MIYYNLGLIIMYLIAGCVGLFCLWISWHRDKYNQKWTATGKLVTALFAFFLWWLFIPAMFKVYEDELQQLKQKMRE